MQGADRNSDVLERRESHIVAIVDGYMCARELQILSET